MVGGEVDQEADEMKAVDRRDAKGTGVTVMQFPVGQKTTADVFLREEIRRVRMTITKSNRQFVGKISPRLWNQERDFLWLQTAQWDALCVSQSSFVSCIDLLS